MGLEIPFWLLMPTITSSNWLMPSAAHEGAVASASHQQIRLTLVLLSRFRTVLGELMFSGLMITMNNCVPRAKRGAFNGFAMAVSGEL